eukprot:gene13290-15309_t
MELDSKVGVVTTPSPRRHKVPSILCTSPNGGFVVGSPKEQELSTSLSNLKWGFKLREQKLQEQLAVHKEALTELYQLHMNLKEKLNDAGTATCVHLEEAENLSALHEENEQQYVHQRLSIETLNGKLIELEEEKNKLEASNQNLQLQLQELQHTLTGSTCVDSTPVISEPPTKLVISSIASVVQAAYVSTETFNVAEGSAIEDSGVMESTGGKQKKEAVPLRRNKQVAVAATNRRHSLESAATKQTTNDEVAAIKDRRSSFPRKGATPKQDPSVINTTKSPVKQSNKVATKVAPRKKQPTTDSLSAVHTDTSSTTTSLSPVKEKVVTPRIPLRQRIEEHSQQLRSRDHNMNHNAWVGGFTTTNRQSGGGVQFFVDVLTPAPRDRVSENDEDFELSGERIMESADQAASTIVEDKIQESLITQLHATAGDTETYTTTMDFAEVVPIVLTLLPPTDTTPTTHNMNIRNTRMSAHSLAEMQLLESDLNAEPEEEVSILYTPVTNVDNNNKHGVHLSVLDEVSVGGMLGISQGIAMVDSEDTNFVADERDDSYATTVQNRKRTKLESTPSLLIDTSATALNVAQPVSPAPSSSNKYLLLEVQMYKRQVVELKKQLADIDVPIKVAVKKVSNIATQVTEASLFVLETSPHVTSADRNAVIEIPALSVDTMQSNNIADALQIEHTPVRTLQELAATTPVAESMLPSIDLGTDLLGATTSLDENAHDVDNLVYDNAGMFVELCDVSVQCTSDVSTSDAASNTDEVYHGTNKKEVASIVTPVGCDAITQTEMITPLPASVITSNQYTTTTPVVMVHTSTCTTSFPTTVDIGIAACIQSARDEALSAAIEASKFDLGKKLFKLRMEERKIAKRSRKDQRDAQKQISVNAGVTTVTNSSNIVMPSLPSAATVNTAAISRANDQAKLNAELIASLQEKSSRHQRDQQKIELLEQKLCRLIMYVKHTNKQNKNNNNTSNADNLTTIAKDAQEVAESKSITPTAGLPHVPIKPTPRLPPLSNKPSKKSVKVGEMSFHGDLSHLLCIDNNDSGTSSEEEIEPTMEMETSNNISDVTDLFSPPRDFEGKYYDEVSEINVTTRSNPLLRQTIASPEYTTSRINNVNVNDVHHESGLAYEDVYQDHSIVDISFGHNMSAFDVPQMASLGNNKADLFSPIQRKIVSRINSASMPGRDVAKVSTGTVQNESIESENKVNKLQQQVDNLEMRNKTLLRDKDLLVGKLKRTFETDTQSFGLKIFSSEHNETYSLENPTVTASVVMGFIDNNNKLLDKIGVLTASLEEKMHQQEKQAQIRAEVDAELTQALVQNRHLSAEVRSLHSVVQNVTHDRDELQRQVSQLTGTLVHMAQENKVLKDKMRMHSF